MLLAPLHSTELILILYVPSDPNHSVHSIQRNSADLAPNARGPLSDMLSGPQCNFLCWDNYTQQS